MRVHSLATAVFAVTTLASPMLHNTEPTGSLANATTPLLHQGSEPGNSGRQIFSHGKDKGDAPPKPKKSLWRLLPWKDAPKSQDQLGNFKDAPVSSHSYTNWALEDVQHTPQTGDGRFDQPRPSSSSVLDPYPGKGKTASDPLENYMSFQDIGKVMGEEGWLAPDDAKKGPLEGSTQEPKLNTDPSTNFMSLEEIRKTLKEKGLLKSDS